MNYFELLKAKHGLPVSDAYTALLGKKLQGGDYPVTEIFSQLPFSFLSRGASISEWTLYGKFVQNGTPTPTSPIPVQGVGERTANLFEHPVYSETTSQGITFTPIENGMLYVSGTPTGYASFALCSRQKIPANLIGQLVTFNFVIRDVVNITWGGITIYDENQTVLYQYQGGTAAPHKITMPDNADTMTATVKRNNNGVVTSGVIGLMLNIGSSALPYEPYGYKISITSNGTTVATHYTDKPLYGTGDNLDYLQRLADGSGVEHRAWVKLVLTGDEDWQWSTGDVSGYVYLAISNAAGYAVQNSEICSHFISKQISGSNNEEGIGVQNKSTPSTMTAILIRHTGLSTDVTTFKSYLAAQYAAGTPVTVIYQLATPTDTPVTLPEIPTAVGTNTLDTDTAVHGDARIKGRIKEIEDSAMNDLLNLMGEM